MKHSAIFGVNGQNKLLFKLPAFLLAFLLLLVALIGLLVGLALPVELLLIIIPFSKLFHVFTTFPSRWYNGDVAGKKGVPV